MSATANPVASILTGHRFWSIMIYDRQTRSMLQTDEPFPSLGSNWVQTVPGKGWFGILRLYSPLQPFFAKSRRPSEIEPPGRELQRARRLA